MFRINNTKKEIKNEEIKNKEIVSIDIELMKKVIKEKGGKETIILDKDGKFILKANR